VTEEKRATFQDVLEKIGNKQETKQRRSRREEWLQALRDLIGRLRHWLDESDPNGVLAVVEEEMETNEPDLGPCTAPSLRIGVDNDVVKVLPIARGALGFLGELGRVGTRAEGRVDITNGLKKESGVLS
jgi:hypothetical protein